MLAMADQHGRVFASIPGLASRARIPIEDARKAIETFLSPDRDSRTKVLEGRRITEIDGGWMLVNHEKYRTLRDDEAILASKRKYINERRARERAERQPVEPVGAVGSTVEQSRPNAEADTEAELIPKSILLSQDCSRPPAENAEPTDEGGEGPKLNGTPGPPDCPHLEVLALWAEVMPDQPQHDPTRWKGKRADHLRARWRETAVAKSWQTQAEGLAYLRKFFTWCRRSQFLMGKVPPRAGHRQFELELAWLVNPENWTKAHEGKYHSEG